MIEEDLEEQRQLSDQRVGRLISEIDRLKAQAHALQAERAALWEVVRAGDEVRAILDFGCRKDGLPTLRAFDLAREKLAGLETPTNAGIVPKP